jgi:HK97 family phage major capsid protein
MIKRESGRELTKEQLMGVKTLLVGSNPDGGYIVPTERQSAIIRRRFEQTPMRSVANQVTIGTTDTDFILDDGEFGSQKVGEVDLRVGTGTSQIGVITIPTHEQSAECVATEKVLDDAVWNLEAWLTGKIAQRFSRIENREFMVGSAAHEAQGICTIPDWVALGNYERNALETRTANGVTYGGVTYLVSGNDLIDVQTDLLEDYQGNAAWFFNRKSWAEICKLQDANGQYLLNPMMLFQGVSPQLLGARVLMSPDLNQFNQGGIVGLYGDFREGYAIVDRLGIRILRDPYTIKGFIVFWARKRTGGAVTNFQAIKRLRVSAST